MKGIVSFYEKPGCEENLKQQKLLTEAGYSLQIIDIESKEWDFDSLTKFIGLKKVHDCVDLDCPLIKDEGLKIDEISEDELLGLMIKNPILIKRPLIFYRGEFEVGFENRLVSKLLES